MKYLFIGILAFMPFSAFAAADVKVSITAEVEVVETIDGKEVKKRVEARELVSGDVIFYTVFFENKGDETAENIDLVDPIPSGTVYVDGTAFGGGTDITFSADNGKTYKAPSLLTYEVAGKKKAVSPEKYSHIRWVVKSLPAGKSGRAGFQVRVK